MTDKRFNRKKKIKALINDPYYQPMKQREIGYLMQVAPEDRDEFVEILNELVEEGSIEVSKRGKYMPPSVKTVKGTFSCTSKGFGFVTVEGEDDDYYIHEKNMNGAFHEDTVLMQVLDDHPTSGRRKEGKIIKILERGIKTVVGTLQKNQNFGFVIPDNLRFDSDIFVSKSQCKNLTSGFKVMVEITDYGDVRRSPEGKIIEVLGHKDDPRVDILSIVKAYGIPTQFEDDVKQQVDTIPSEIKASDYKDRMDIRDWPMVTIDGEDAKDLDDAITLSRKGKNYLLGVHIADVSEYVTEDDHPTSGRRKEGKIIKILERGIKTVVGTLQKNQNFGFVIPDNLRFDSDIFVSKSQCKNLTSGFKVMVEITDYGDARRSPEGKIIEVLGHKDDPRVDILSIVKAYGIPTQFEDDVKQQVDTIPSEIKASDYKDRMDIRDWPMVTIDGEDAKDLDDAITLSRKGKNYLLGVHIADVSEYVTEYSPLDKEALKRGTSVYLVDRVIPMLPHQLSNGICSLNQGCDRLALSCIMEVDPSGKVVDHQIAETLINVDHRMTYTSVAKILDGDMEERNKYEDFVEMFELMKELSDILRHRRHERGSIDFDFPEDPQDHQGNFA